MPACNSLCVGKCTIGAPLGDISFLFSHFAAKTPHPAVIYMPSSRLGGVGRVWCIADRGGDLSWVFLKGNRGTVGRLVKKK